MGAPGGGEMKLASIGGLDQDLIAGLQADIGHRGALHQHLALFGRPHAILRADEEQALVIVIVQGIQGQIAPGLALAIQRDAQGQGAAALGLAHTAHMTDALYKIFIQHRLGLEDGVGRAHGRILGIERFGQCLLGCPNQANRKDTDGDGEDDQDGARAVAPQVAGDFCPAHHFMPPLPLTSLTITPSAI